MRTTIVDASVGAKWFVKEIFSNNAFALFHPDNRLYAPDFFLLEVDNVFCKRVRRGEMSRQDANEGRAMLRRFPIEYFAFAPLQDRACAIALETGRSIYDCLYLSLAILLDGKMATADRRFYESVKSSAYSRFVVWIQDIS